MPGYLRTGGYLRHVQPMALRDGITEWARTFFQEEDRVIKYPFLKRRTRSTASWRLSLRDTPAYTVRRCRQTHPGLLCSCMGLFIYMVLGSRVHPHSLLGVRNHLRSVVGREDMMAMADLCLPFFLRHSLSVRADLAALYR